MMLFKKDESSKAVNVLIEEQLQKEAAEVYRRGWCVQQATMFSDECSAAEVIRKAEQIYEYVYGPKE